MNQTRPYMIFKTMIIKKTHENIKKKDKLQDLKNFSI